ncbi:MAG: hypothetical protein EZS28_002545 [Streblomastix strix]|uniref:Uncharacterized protein n=1 Tax=Streblomastix strix TaxID=222440 RepID=A0A5J4X3Y5_9EUKA|nr:MAG: hypothetical protein EZS28_002545 [Streblomastix strix]
MTGVNIGTLSTQNASNFEYFECLQDGALIDAIRTIPPFQSNSGQLTLLDGYIHDIILSDCSLIEISGQSSTSTAQVEIRHCRFERISLHKANDANPNNHSILPSQCCVIQIKVPNTSHYDSHSYQFVDNLFCSITAGEIDDPLFRMTAHSDYAPVMITYEGYPSVQIGSCECNILLKRSRFISTHGSHTGAIDIRGRIQTVQLDLMTFSKTVAQDGIIFTSGAAYGNVLYVAGNDDISHFASGFINLCRSDSDSPKLAAQSNLDIGSFDYLVPDFYNTITVSVSGSDTTGIGIDTNPFQTVYTAVALSNPKKASFVEKIFDQENVMTTINIKAGTYIEPRIRIISERISVNGEGMQNTIIKNDITSDEKTSCVLSIETDNTECKLDINDIAFEQQNQGSLGYDALIMIQYGEVRLYSCSFRQTDPSIQHNTPYIRIMQKYIALSGISISNSNFSYNTAAIEVIPGGGAILNGCNFTSISGAAVLSAVLSEIQADLIMYNCKFLTCQSYSGSIPSGSPISISCSFQQDFSNNKVQSILKSPVCFFTQCEFNGNTGYVNCEVQFLDEPISIGFVQCNINSNNISFSSQWDNTYLNEAKSYSFGGCSGSASDATIYVNINGLDIDPGTSTNPFRTLSQAINQKTQGGQSLLTLSIGQGTWEDDGLNIGARSISIEGAGANDTVLMNQISNRVWLACVIGGKLYIVKIGLRQASASESYGGMLTLLGGGQIELTSVAIKQRDLQLNQTSSTIYASAGSIIITESSFERVSFTNTLSPPVYAATIYCEDKFGSLSITNSNFTQKYTSLVDPPTSDSLKLQNNVEYGGGCIVIQNAQVLRLVECNFTQNNGWRTGVINIQKMRNNWLFQENEQSTITSYIQISHCNFINNNCLKDTAIQSISLKRNIGHDIILDHIYTKNETIRNITQSSSSSQVPKIGSVHKQFQLGILDYILFIRRTVETAYVSIEGINQITASSGQHINPFQTVEFAIFHITSMTQAAHILLFPGNFTEQALFVGGHNLVITGTPLGLDEPEQNISAYNTPGLSEIQNSNALNQDLIQVFNGILTLQLLVIRLDNSNGVSTPFCAIAIHGTQASATVEYCSFNVTDPRGYLDREFLSLDRGGNLTMRQTQIHNIFEKHQPILFIAVSEKSTVIMQQINIQSCKINESSSGVVHLQYFTGGTATLSQCQFNYNVAVTFAFTGNKPFGGGLLIQLCESPLSSSYIYDTKKQLLESSRLLLIRDCIFDTNIGDCSGAVTISGTRTLLQEERFQFIHCEFESSIAGSLFEHAEDPYGNDMFFYIVDGYKEIIVMKGQFDEPMFITRDITFTITGQGYLLTSLCNSKTKENSLIWTMPGSNVIMQDCTLFRFSELSTTARLLECDPGSRLIIKRCVICNDPQAKQGDKFNAGLCRAAVTSGGFFDTTFYNSQLNDVSPIIVNCSASEFNFNQIEKNSDGSCQFKTGQTEPKNNPTPVYFEFYNVTFKHISSNEVYTPFISIYATPSLGVSFDLCMFEENTFILVDLRQSYFDTSKGQIGQIQFKHCTWMSNGKTWKFDGNDWKSDQMVESGGLVIQHSYYPDGLEYDNELKNCKINIGSVIVDSCIFVDNVGTQANDILIEDSIYNENLISFRNCFTGSQITGTTSNFATFTFKSDKRSKNSINQASIPGISSFAALPERNLIIDSTSIVEDEQLTYFVAMMLRSDPGYNIRFQTGISLLETSLNVRYNKLSIFKDDSVQEEVIFRAKEAPISPNSQFYLNQGINYDPYSPLISVEQSGEIYMKSIVILHFYEKSLNSVIQVKDEAKFNGVQLVFRPIEEQLLGMMILPKTEQTSPYLLCLGGFTILESCEFFPTIFDNSAAIRTKYEIGINSKEGTQQDDYTLTLKGCQMIGMNRIDGAENSGAAIEAYGMKVTLESCIFDMNTQQFNMMKNKINKQDIKRNEGELTKPEEHLIPSCAWNSAYIRQNTGSLILSQGTQLKNLFQGAISLLGANLTIVDADVQFLNNINSDLLQGIHINEDEPIIIKPTLLRRNIACGYGSRITSPIENFSENGLQEDSLWILKTDEGKLGQSEQQENVYENECQLFGGLKDVKSPLFIPHIDKASGIMSQDKLGLDISIIGRHLVRCGVVKYKVCEKMKVTNDDGQELEEKVQERELHCQTELMENSLQWDNEKEFTIQTSYQIIPIHVSGILPFYSETVNTGQRIVLN